MRGKNWTQEELDYISEVWGEKTIPQIAQHLGRSIDAVKVKAGRLGYTGQIWYGNMMSARKVSELLGVDIHTVTDHWIPQYGLKAKAKRRGKSKRTTTIIMFDDLLLWLKSHQDLWDSRRLEMYSLGAEYKWLKEKRKNDKNIPERRAQKWTPEEDAKIIAMFRRGDMTYSDIAGEVGRSASSVEHRIHRLDVWGTGKYIGREQKEERKQKSEKFDRISLFVRLRKALLVRRNSMGFGEYWQKDMCMNWDDLSGCTAGETDCDTCTSYRRIQPQYCKRCGRDFYERAENLFCKKCRDERRKNAQRKWAVLNKKSNRKDD